MKVSRKEFLSKGIFYLGQALFPPAAGAGERTTAPVEENPVEEAHLRPPGFTEGQEAVCGGCTACMEACPQGIVTKEGEDAPPHLDFSRGWCNFCNLCVSACQGGVLEFPDDPCLGVAEAAGERCLAQAECFSCIRHCPQEAITFQAGRGIVIDRARCTGCGRCEHLCPGGEKAVRVAHPRR